MIVVVVTLRAIILTQCVTNGIVGGWDNVDDSLLYKGLQCAVNGYPVESFPGPFFYVPMGQCAGLLQEKL